MDAAGEVGAEPIGRDEELAGVRAFLDSAGSSRALVLSGGPGIGKTTLWEAGIAAARERGFRVLSCRASSAEARLSFAALIDLLDGVDGGDLAHLPAPQLQALEVALLRAEPAGAPPESGAIALGFLNALRSLAADGHLLVAVDDVQWLDPPSAEALAYAARRLAAEPVGFLLARRPGRSFDLERAFGAKRLDRIEVGPLSLGALRLLLSRRLKLSLPRYLLRRLLDSTLGNPLFALEVGRMLVEAGEPAVGRELPVPDAVEDLLGTRVARLPARARRLLLAVALSADLSTSQLGMVVDPAAVEDAIGAGLLQVEGDRVRAGHPLLAAAAKKHARSSARRDLHRELARVVTDEQLQARHLALAVDDPDEGLAAIVAAAASKAAARGAWQEALELAEHALRLTPPDAPARPDRLLAVGHDLVVAGEKQRVTDLLSAELESLPPGASRAQGWMLLAGGAVGSNDDIRGCFERALEETGNDPGLRASVLASISENNAVIRVERIGEAEASADEALPAARRAGPEIERSVLYALSWARSLHGSPIDDLCERHRASSDAVADLAVSPERVAGQRLVWRGEVEQARRVLVELLSVADGLGEGYSYALQRLHVCELELRIGDWRTAAALLEEWDEPSERELVIWPMYERCQALLAAGRGLPDDAERWAGGAIGRAEATGVRWDLLEALRARGVAALLAHKPARAAESLRRVWEHTVREGIDEPGVFPVAPDLVEALVELGEADEAAAVIDRLATLAEEQEHPWGLATAKRSGALLRLASDGYDEEAAAELADAAEDYGGLGLRFDRARTLLSLGRVQRRSKKWALARRSLEDAADAFEEIGSGGWVEDARSELARVGARRPRPEGTLTPAEQRVAELAAAGLANKEIAHTLFVSVHTVEEHLSHAYAKLGIRSRSQLASRLPTPG